MVNILSLLSFDEDHAVSLRTWKLSLCIRTTVSFATGPSEVNPANALI